MTRIVILAIGDPNGIGPEIAVKSVLAKSPSMPRIVLAGDEHVVRYYSGNREIRSFDINQPIPGADVIELLPIDSIAPQYFAPGQCNKFSGKATVDYVEAAFALASRLPFATIVACPHNETAVNAAGITFSGYPSLLARLAGLPESSIFLMLVGANLRIVHVTLHEQLSSAVNRLGSDLVVKASRTAHQALQTMGLKNPRIGIMGINPHAGEGGLFGDDDEFITVPAALMLRSEGLDIVGPAGADTLLAEGRCDAYVAMYHDQGHIPIKLIAGRSSAAWSIGARVPFASVGHGSAPDIAGQNKADPNPLICILQLLASGEAAIPKEDSE